MPFYEVRKTVKEAYFRTERSQVTYIFFSKEHMPGNVFCVLGMGGPAEVTQIIHTKKTTCVAYVIKLHVNHRETRKMLLGDQKKQEPNDLRIREDILMKIKDL